MRDPQRASRRPLLVTRPVLATVLGISLRQVGALEAEGLVVPTVRGKAGRASRYDLATVVPAYIAHVSGGPAARGPRDAYWRARAEREQLTVAQARGALISREDVLHAGRSYTRAWCTMLARLPQALRHAGAPPAIVDEARRQVDTLRCEIAAWRTVADLEAAIAASPDPDPIPSTKE